MRNASDRGPWEGYRRQAKPVVFLSVHIFIEGETSGYEADRILLRKKYCLARTRDNAVMKATKQAIPPSLHIHAEIKQALFPKHHIRPPTNFIPRALHPNTLTLGRLLVYWVV